MLSLYNINTNKRDYLTKNIKLFSKKINGPIHSIHMQYGPNIHEYLYLSRSYLIGNLNTIKCFISKGNTKSKK